MDIQTARLLHSLRRIQPTVQRMPPIYGAQFGAYPRTEDVTFMADQPQTWAQSVGLEPLPQILPYIDPVFQYETSPERMEEQYADLNTQLDNTELKPQPPMLDRGEIERQRQGLPPPVHADMAATPLPPLDPALVTRVGDLLRMQGRPSVAARLGGRTPSLNLASPAGGDEIAGGGGSDTLAGAGGDAARWGKGLSMPSAFRGVPDVYDVYPEGMAPWDNYNPPQFGPNPYSAEWLRNQAEFFHPSWLGPDDPGGAMTNVGEMLVRTERYRQERGLPPIIDRSNPNWPSPSQNVEDRRNIPMSAVQGDGGSNTLAGGGGETLTMGPNEEAIALQYANQEAIRDWQLSDKLSPILATAATAAGVDDIRVTSGGQPAIGVKGVDRIGSHRHDLGRAGDIQLLINGRVLDFNDPNDRPIFEKFISTAVAAGARGVGAGSDYMGTKTIHVGFGSAGAWGAKGKSSNAPAWLTAAYDAGRASPNVAVDPAAVAAFEAGAPQFTDAQSAIASLIDPTGGTLTPSIPAGTEAYAPFLPPAASAPAPAQATPSPAPAAPFVPASGPIGPNLGSMLSPADVLNAGPRPRPAALSPVRPPMPNTTDRNLGILPPVPRLRPGGAPDAGMVPLPPMRPAPAASMANMPAMVGMPPSAAPGGVGAFSAPGAPSDLIPFLPPVRGPASTAIAPPLERANRIAGGQGGPVIPITPDEMRSSLANAGANTEMSLGLGGGLGTPETAMSLERSFPPPRPGWDQLQSESDSRLLASDIARTRGMMERSMAPLPRFDTAPPPARPNITPDFDFAAGPGPTFTPPSLAPDIRGRPEYPGSMPAAPPPLANAADDPYRAPSSFDASRPLNGGGGSNVLAAGNASPLPLPPSPFRYDPLSSIRVPPVAEVPIPGTRFLPSDADPDITLPTEATAPIDLRPPAQVDAEQAPTIDPVVAAANMPVRPQQPIVKAAAAAAAAPAKTTEEQKKRGGVPSFLAPFFGGGGVAGFFGGFGTPPAFTPYANPIMNTGFGGTIRTSGKTPSGTPWSTGTSNALGGSNALRWTGSGGQTITAYTDPVSGTTFHSFS